MSQWSVWFAKTAERDLTKLDLQLRRRIIDKLQWFSENFDLQKPESLKGEYSDFDKLRVGKQRIFYRVDQNNKMIRVYYIDPRDKAYK